MHELPETKLEKFRREIREVALQEIADGHADFDNQFVPDQLNKDDMKIYNNFKDGTLNDYEIDARRMDIDRKLNESQRQLLAYLGNKSGIKMLRKELSDRQE